MAKPDYNKGLQISDVLNYVDITKGDQPFTMHIDKVYADPLVVEN